MPDLRGKVAETFWDPHTSASAVDTIGHGTFVSSIVSAANDDGFGMAGFCGACRVAVYKAEPLTNLQIATGIKRLTDAHVRIINLSLVTPRASQDIVDAINYALAAGVLVVAASGNEGDGTVDFPASLLQPGGGVAAGGIAAGASDAAGNRASFSNWGDSLTMLAPGAYDARCTVGMLGAIPSNVGQFDSGQACDTVFSGPAGTRYAYASGTSFAAPAIAGVAALVWAAAPSLTNVQVAGILEQTARRPAGAGWTPDAGWGVLDAKAAVEAALGRTAGGDGLRLSDLRIAPARTPGAAAGATLRAAWADTMPVVVGATPSCRVDAGGAPIAARASLGAGVVTCAFTLPPRSAGERVHGTVSLVADGATPASGRFAFTVRSRPG